jgi:hypothetical protein
MRSWTIFVHRLAVPVLLGGAAVGVLAGRPARGAQSAAHAVFRPAGELLLLETPRWSLSLDAQTGAIREIADRTGQGRLLWGAANLWCIERHQDADIEASGCDFTHHWDAQQHMLSLHFDSVDAAIEIVCTARDEGPAWQAVVRMKRGTMLRWRFPDLLEFDAEVVREFVFPEHLGLAFTRSFFQPGGVGVQRHALGSAGLLQVAEDRCQMRPVQDAPVRVQPGADADGWLPQWYRNEMPRWRVTANRCPAGDRHELSLVETEHGTWLSASRLGGWGWFFRLGGRLQDADARPRTASVIATLARVYHQPPTDGTEVVVPGELAGQAPAAWPTQPRRIGLVLARPTGRPGVRLSTDAGQLLRELARQDWVVQAGIQVVALQDPGEIREALDAPREWFALINTIAEGFPAESADSVPSMLQAMRDYVRRGGTWWEAGGGYPLYHAVVPQQDGHFESANRDFCDFAALDSPAGRWALFGVQAPDSIFLPPRAEIASTGPAGQRVGRYRHAFLAFARAGETVHLPRQQMVLGVPHRQVLAQYASQNGLTRGLCDKASGDVVERLKRSILLKVTTRDLKASARIAEQLPFPVLFHIVDYLHGGFDKQYPDHLPPNPQVGTPADLTRLVEACRDNGHLLMPYTNPTWWCVNPKGPTFEKHGEAPLARDLEGNVYAESYGSSSIQGYTVCPWHPAVRAANDVIRQQFTEQYPVDVLFQDQVGARQPRWDTNPAAPVPGAYLEGIHRIAQVDSAFVPLGTEDGHDRLINWETMFCGLSWPWLPNRSSRSRVLYEDLWPREAWRIEPLALFLAHDKVLFYHHDLGGFVRNRRDLSITLAMGYGLSWWTHTERPSPAERDWIERLCRLQAAIGPRCAGRALDQFEYLAPEVIRSRWGDLEILANLTDKPWTVDAETVVAPEGFCARSSDLEAGIFVRHGGEETGTAARWLIRENRNGTWTQWSAEDTDGP